MEVISEVSKARGHRFLRYHFFRSNPGNRMVVVALAAWFTGNYTGYNNGHTDLRWINFFAGFFAGGLIAWLAVFFFPFLWERYQWSTASRRDIFEKKSITTGDKGFGVNGDQAAEFVPWGRISVFRTGGGFIYMKLLSGKMYLIPVDAFPSEQAATQFIDTCRGALYNARPDLRPKKPRQLYAWGLLGLIPGIGEVVGVILFIKGVFQFRSKVLVLIGIGCILYTMAFWHVVLTYVKKRFPEFDKPASLHGFARPFLDGAVGQIEAFKVKNGVYPDSLEQIGTPDSRTFLVDPFSMDSKEDSLRLFNYKRVGDHYILSCSGPDLLAGTQDDIFPDSAYFDSTRFGLMRK